MDSKRWGFQCLWALLVGGALAALGSGTVAAAEQRPNIVLIMVDDIGIGGFSCYGSDKYQTPQIDALAQSGVRFEHCFSMALCGPSRACLLTGRYAFRTGMTGNNTGKKVTPDREVCVARVLREAGYTTAFAGKWNQLSYLNSPEDARRWGWDEYLVWDSSDSPGRYWKPRYYKNGELLRGVEDRYGPDLCHEFAVDFISRHKDRPFFLYCPMVLVHGPIMRTPDSPPGSKDLRRDMVAYMDKLVGKLVEELGRQKLLERTVILFTSDNGTPGTDTIGGKAIDGRKGSMQEGGTRVPLIVSWKGTIAAGRVCSDLVDFSDFFPTLVELAGAKPPSGVVLDGRSFVPQLLGRPGNPREWVYVQLQDRRYVRDKRWKLYGDGTLCDMKDAPFREIVIEKGTEDGPAAEARKRLQAVLDRLN
jgi:arylsulfatase A